LKNDLHNTKEACQKKELDGRETSKQVRDLEDKLKSEKYKRKQISKELSEMKLNTQKLE
jgi:hypothetical protein